MKKSFTLIELLIVLVIIGVIITIAVPQYQRMVEKARMAQAVATMGAIYRAQEAYRAETGSYYMFTVNEGDPHETATLGLNLIRISANVWGDKYFHYECRDSWPANPVYLDGWNCLATPNYPTLLPFQFRLLLDFQTRKIKITKDDLTWEDYNS